MSEGHIVDVNEMVVRVAKALAPAAWGWYSKIGDTLAQESRRKASLKHARVAIQAMREPTEGMLAAGDSQMPQFHPDEGYLTGRDVLVDVWPDMIDAALTESAPRGE